MYLTLAEFKTIRPLKWSMKEIHGKIYRTITNVTDTKLFWIDFMRNIFAPNFKRQNGICFISNFDYTQPVFISPDLKLELPDILESVMYFSRNKTPPIQFKINISQTALLIIAIVLLLGLMCTDIIYGSKKTSPVWLKSLII